MIGIDIVNIENFAKKINNEYFIKKAFTENEIYYASLKKDKIKTLAGMYAAKEATIKAYNLNLGSILRGKIEINHINNKPELLISGKKIPAEISISHDGLYAIGICFQEENIIQIKVDKEIKKLMPNRKANSHKGDYGRIGFLGGSPGMAGSIYMSSMAALRAGGGLVYTIVPQSISQILQIKANEQIVKEIPCQEFYYDDKIIKDILSTSKDLDVLAIGPGMGKQESLNKLIAMILSSTEAQIIIDADGLNALSRDLSILNPKKSIVLTPHIKEFSRLSGLSIKEINSDRVKISQDFARRNKLVLVLKSESTIVTDGDKTYINKIGNPGMATAGSGDVLTGIIASFLHRLSPYDAAVLGVYLHSLSGDIARQKLGEDSLIATDIINNLSEAIKLMR